MAASLIETLWNRLHGRTIRTIWGEWFTPEEWRIECLRARALRIELKKQTPFVKISKSDTPW